MTDLPSELVAIDRLNPYPTNPREGDIGAITESLRTLGQYRPIVVNRRQDADTHMTVLAGNHTLKAAEALGWTEIAVTWVDVDDETAARIVVVDNRTNDLASYDDQLLADLLTDLAQTDLGLVATGYDGDALDQLLADLETPLEYKTGREGTVGAYPENPKTKLGDVIHLGPHILVCGDATDPASYSHLPEAAALVWTDPPYGVSVQEKNEWLSASGVDAWGPRNVAPVTGDTLKGDELAALWVGAFTRCLESSRDDAAFYSCAPPTACDMARSANDAGWQVRHHLVWVKDVHTLGRSDYHYRHETILYGWAKRHQWYGDRTHNSVFEQPRPRSHKLHPTSKPVPLIEPMIQNSSPPGAWVLDPFAGSGSTLIACENLNRNGYMIELDPGYCDIITDRWKSLNPE